jgi:hypothetical protein
VRLGRRRRDRPRLAADGVEPVEASVRELREEGDVAVVPDGAAAVLVDPRPCVRPGRCHVDRRTSRAGLDDDDTAGLFRSRLGPAHARAVDGDRAEPSAAGARNEIGTDRAGPGP